MRLEPIPIRLYLTDYSSLSMFSSRRRRSWIITINQIIANCRVLQVFDTGHWIRELWNKEEEGVAVRVDKCELNWPKSIKSTNYCKLLVQMVDNNSNGYGLDRHDFNDNKRWIATQQLVLDWNMFVVVTGVLLLYSTPKSWLAGRRRRPIS